MRRPIRAAPPTLRERRTLCLPSKFPPIKCKPKWGQGLYGSFDTAHIEKNIRSEIFRRTMGRKYEVSIIAWIVSSGWTESQCWNGLTFGEVRVR
jgi:hypothetical protein